MAPFPLRLRHLDAPLHHRPNTCSTWSKPKDYSQSHNVARPMQTGIETWSPDGLWDEVQRSPQRCSQAFRSSQKRTADLHIYKAGDPRRALSPDVFHAGFLPQAVAHANGVHVREPARPNMVFESRSDRIAGPRRQNRPALLADLPPRRIDHPPSARDHPPLSTRPSTVDPANHMLLRVQGARPRGRESAARCASRLESQRHGWRGQQWMAKGVVDGHAQIAVKGRRTSASSPDDSRLPTRGRPSSRIRSASSAICATCALGPTPPRHRARIPSPPRPFHTPANRTPSAGTRRVRPAPLASSTPLLQAASRSSFG